VGFAESGCCWDSNYGNWIKKSRPFQSWSLVPRNEWTTLVCRVLHSEEVNLQHGSRESSYVKMQSSHAPLFATPISPLHQYDHKATSGDLTVCSSVLVPRQSTKEGQDLNYGTHFLRSHRCLFLLLWPGRSSVPRHPRSHKMHRQRRRAASSRLSSPEKIRRCRSQQLNSSAMLPISSESSPPKRFPTIPM